MRDSEAGLDYFWKARSLLSDHTKLPFGVLLDAGAARLSEISCDLARTAFEESGPF